eukprot:CAMPEP_0175685670 /NCGR_PEP_ID=MMETSP0097-20121207/27478_1 /TAXON_ID=311494 /ORGANISM="Alexandrium monilatum, Strain CCMP3105" /LENGTH=295 /DNA_ID=CAMNT_0016992649 /DNA_START=1 /DNA_END=888 /DNA_ORIENTATION=+
MEMADGQDDLSFLGESETGMAARSGLRAPPCRLAVAALLLLSSAALGAVAFARQGRTHPLGARPGLRALGGKGGLDSLPRLTTAVVVHGYDVDREDWVHVVWGSLKEQRLGRLPQGLLIGYLERADHVWLGGARDSRPTEEYLWRHLDELRSLAGLSGLDFDEFERWVRRVVVRGSGRNTREEVQAAFAAFSQLDPPVGRVVLVSSPAHAPRCLRDASAELVRLEAAGGAWRPLLLAAQSGTNFGAAPPGARPVVLEPEHPLYSLVGRCIGAASRGSTPCSGVYALLGNASSSGR